MAIDVDDLARICLPGAQYADRFAVTVADRALDAEQAARLVMGRVPPWVSRLMTLRNALVRPFRLKTELPVAAATERIGFFPVISRSAETVVLGLDDRHLDFRVLFAVEELGAGCREVSATTLVLTHNLLGRVYLALVKPFHRVIVPAMLARIKG